MLTWWSWETKPHKPATWKKHGNAVCPKGSPQFSDLARGPRPKSPIFSLPWSNDFEAWVETPKSWGLLLHIGVSNIQVLCFCYIIQDSQNCEIDIDLIPILWRNKLRLREVELLVQVHIAAKWQSSVSNSAGISSTEPPCLLYLHFAVSRNYKLRHH